MALLKWATEFIISVKVTHLNILVSNSLLYRLEIRILYFMGTITIERLSNYEFLFFLSTNTLRLVLLLKMVNVSVRNLR